MNAVVGVGGAAIPMKLRVRPCARNVDTRGVIKGNGTPLAMFDSVMVDGVRRVGEGGNTNNVCEGVCMLDTLCEEFDF